MISALCGKILDFMKYNKFKSVQVQCTRNIYDSQRGKLLWCHMLILAPKCCENSPIFSLNYPNSTLFFSDSVRKSIYFAVFVDSGSRQSRPCLGECYHSF